MTNLSDFEIVPFPDIEDGNVIFEDVHDMSDWVVVQSSQDQKSNDAVESIRKRIHTTSEVFPKNYIGGVYCSPNCTSRFYDQYVTHHTKIQPMTSEWQDQIVSFEKHIRVSEKKSINSLILSGKRAGKRDDMCLTLMRAIRNMYLFKKESYTDVQNPFEYYIKKEYKRRGNPTNLLEILQKEGFKYILKL